MYFVPWCVSVVHEMAIGNMRTAKRRAGSLLVGKADRNHFHDDFVGSALKTNYCWRRREPVSNFASN